MMLIQRLRAFAPQIVESPHDVSEYLWCRVDGGAGGIARGASLTVRADEFALLAADNRIVNSLEPGIHTLDRQRLGELEAIHAWPPNDAGPIGADVWFVSMLPARRLVWQCPASNGATPCPFEAGGTIDFAVIDAKRFAAYHLEHGHDDDSAVRRAIERAICSALRAMLDDPAADPDSLAGDRRGTARMLRKRLRAILESRGFGEVSLRIRHLQRPHQSAVAESAASVPAAGNVTPLPFDRDGPRRASTDIGDANQSPAHASADEVDEIAALEREIERLDAWSSLGASARNSDPQTLAEPPSATEDAPRRRLPASLQSLSFYLAVDMQQSGPFDAGELEQAIDQGRVDESTLIWFRGMEDWKRAGEVADIAALLPSPGGGA